MQEKFDSLKACILIPTYNNAATLGKVIDGAAAYTTNIIVVNDGSTDDTAAVLQNTPFVKTVTYPHNKGKGFALRKGFAFALQLGYDYAITIDSDGQHFSSDIPAFINELEYNKNMLFVGARNMNQASVPGKSSFGNQFSNFWYKVETGIALPDTQSGFRLYPVRQLQSIRFYTRKYEFEIEVLVRAAWKGIPVKALPVSVYYPPKDQRVSHFRPFKDFTRISILNTVLVLVTFLYIKPRNFFRFITKKNNWKEALKKSIINPLEADSVKACSIAFGVFMGIIPLWGFQLITAIFLSVVFRLNKALVIIAANISIPPMIPLIVFLSYKAGAYWVSSNQVNFSFSRSITLSEISLNLRQYIFGSITLAVVAGAFFGLLTFALLKLFKRKNTPVPQA